MQKEKEKKKIAPIINSPSFPRVLENVSCIFFYITDRHDSVSYLDPPPVGLGGASISAVHWSSFVVFLVNHNLSQGTQEWKRNIKTTNQVFYPPKNLPHPLIIIIVKVDSRKAVTATKKVAPLPSDRVVRLSFCDSRSYPSPRCLYKFSSTLI